MKNYVKPEIEQILLSAGDIMNTSGDPTDQIKSAYRSWASVIGDLDDNGGYN